MGGGGSRFPTGMALVTGHLGFRFQTDSTSVDNLTCVDPMPCLLISYGSAWKGRAVSIFEPGEAMQASAPCCARARCVSVWR